MPRPLHDHTLPSPIPAQPACRRLPTRAAGHGRARALTAVWRQLRGRLALALALGFASVSAAWAGPFSYLQGLGVDITNGMGAIDRPAAAWTPSAAGVSFQIEDSVGAGGLVGPGIGKLLTLVTDHWIGIEPYLRAIARGNLCSRSEFLDGWIIRKRERQ